MGRYRYKRIALCELRLYQFVGKGPGIEAATMTTPVYSVQEYIQYTGTVMKIKKTIGDFRSALHYTYVGDICAKTISSILDPTAQRDALPRWALRLRWALLIIKNNTTHQELKSE